MHKRRVLLTLHALHFHLFLKTKCFDSLLSSDIGWRTRALPALTCPFRKSDIFISHFCIVHQPGCLKKHDIVIFLHLT